MRVARRPQLRRAVDHDGVSWLVLFKGTRYWLELKSWWVALPFGILSLIYTVWVLSEAYAVGLRLLSYLTGII
jgi:hypothetical protein